MTDLTRLAAGLLTRGRGMLALDQTRAEVEAMLCRARVATTVDRCAELHDLVLTTPGLDRMLGGVLLTPAALHARAPTEGRAGGGPRPLVERRRPIGVTMDDECRVRAELAAAIARHAAAGASFALHRLPAADSTTCGVVGQWAVACQRGGVLPLVRVQVPTAAHQGLAEAEQAHTEAVAGALAALGRAGADPAAVVLVVGMVVPGPRSSQVATSEDVARATVRSLRGAGACTLGGVVFTPPARAGQLSAHLAAVQWLHPDWPFGFCLGAELLAQLAAIWRGRPGRVAAARHELVDRLTGTTAVLRAAG